MKIIDAINKVDALKPNGYTQEEKVAWLSTLDEMIKRDVIDKHFDGDDIVFDGYDDDTPISTEMIAEPPYDDMYIAWLESKIDYFNSEYSKYNNSIIRFNDIYRAYVNDYNRSHMPKGSNIKYY